MGSFPLETRFLHMSAWECGWSAVIASSAIVLVGVLTLKTLAAKTRNGKNTKRLAPGPRGIPLLGYLPFIWKPYHVVFHELSKRYGPIVRVRLGDKDVVVLHDLKSIREALTNPDVLYRPRDFLFNYLGVEGIAVMNGQPWQTNRRYCFHVLRNLGFAKKSMEEHIHEELQCFTDLLSSSKGKPMLVAQPLVSSVANNISALVFGRRYGLDDAKGRHVVGQLSKFLRYGNFFSVLDFLPVVRLLAFYIPYTSLRVMRSISKELTKVVREEIKQREENTDDKLEADFIDGYMRKIKENEGTDSHYTLKYLEGNALNFYGPATNPVRTIILWLVYLVASDPDGVQASIQKEIDSVIGRQRAPEWNDRNKMPFTMASILETLRWRTTAPLSLHRAAGRDTTIGGYDIPAGTLVVPNLSTLHNDPEHWPNPSQFDATRFLNADGTEVDEKSLAYMPFSIGRRACPGETLALMEIFLYVTTMLQKFRVLPEEGKTISLEIQRALLDVVDETQALRFIPR
uniref:Putative cytochrome p450 cyp2 subfamily protein n=1 Tax=Amblyomma triste TaxID=251400 RepID=A0A023GN25_AMBTT